MRNHPSCALDQRTPARRDAVKGYPTKPSGFDVEHLATVAGLVAHGLGVSLVPELALFQFRDLGLIDCCPVGEQGIGTTDPDSKTQGSVPLDCCAGSAGFD